MDPFFYLGLRQGGKKKSTPVQETDEAASELIKGEGQDEDDPDFEVQDSAVSATTSSNPSRPRTLSAGYDSKNQVMTVLFRDGQWWEYRGVSPSIWRGFKFADSKGKYLRSSGLDSWGDMGPANVSAMPRHRRVQLNQLTNWAQNMYPNERPYEG
jgi:hypothetical protein